MNKPNYMFSKILEHAGHDIEIATYGQAKDNSHLYATEDRFDIENVSIECITCNEVLIDFDKEEEE